MYVTIAATKYADCPEYRGAELKVPAVRALVQDAMERARVPVDGEYRMITFRGWPGRWTRKKFPGMKGCWPVWRPSAGAMNAPSKT